MKQQIMLDLETMGTKPGSAILSIGAVKFGFGGQGITDEFYRRIDIESCTALGMKIDAATVIWWMKQSDKARFEVAEPGLHLSKALLQFCEWVGGVESEVWGNGAAFDNVLLSCAYDAARISRPWKYTNDRCYRTAKNLWPPEPLEHSGTQHNALDDARSQALHLIRIIRAMGACVDV